MRSVTSTASDTAVPLPVAELVSQGELVAVAMSGGVDSSVAAARLVDLGLNVVGVTLSLWEGDAETRRDKGCCSVDAVDDARRVAELLGISHYVWNMKDLFVREVSDPFLDAYFSGVTPNPCLRCNQQIKFGALAEGVEGIGASWLATGHYAQTGRRQGTATLHRAKDVAKDQSYTVHRMGQRRLASSLFPLGEMESKAAVRSYARERGLITADKRESQDLCFLDGSLKEHLALHGPSLTPGPVVLQSGNVIGQHGGAVTYTVGQRIGGAVSPTTPSTVPLYVLSIDAKANTVVVGEVSALLSDEIDVADVVWCGEPPCNDEGLELQLRSHGELHGCQIHTTEDGFVAQLATRARAVCPGQGAVVYRGDEVVGGGVVMQARKREDSQ